MHLFCYPDISSKFSKLDPNQKRSRLKVFRHKWTLSSSLEKSLLPCYPRQKSVGRRRNASFSYLSLSPCWKNVSHNHRFAFRFRRARFRFVYPLASRKKIKILHFSSINIGNLSAWTPQFHGSPLIGALAWLACLLPGQKAVKNTWTLIGARARPHNDWL